MWTSSPCSPTAQPQPAWWPPLRRVPRQSSPCDEQLLAVTVNPISGQIYSIVSNQLGRGAEEGTLTARAIRVTKASSRFQSSYRYYNPHRTPRRRAYLRLQKASAEPHLCSQKRIHDIDPQRLTASTLRVAFHTLQYNLQPLEEHESDRKKKHSTGCLCSDSHCSFGRLDRQLLFLHLFLFM
jgi:hypothetical protein